MRIIVFSIFLSLGVQLFAQDDLLCRHFDEAGRVREHNVDFISMQLHVDFNTTDKKVFGKVNYIFQPLRETVRELVLDAPDIKIESILLNNIETPYEVKEELLYVNFKEKLSWNKQYVLEIKYEAQPEKGLYFLGWDDPTNRARKQIWTQGQGIDNRYWIPGFDDVSDKLLTETFITFENGYEVISNGNFIEKTAITDSTTQWHYKMNEPQVLYLVMIAIGKYAYKDITSTGGIVNRQYYYPEYPEEFEPSYQYSKEMMDWMEKEFGVVYPWGQIYRNVPVVDFIYGAMENTTATIYTDYYLQNEREALERNYVGTNAHELTHQWFGDYITEWSGTSHWLHESFATYYSKKFVESITSKDEYDWVRYGEMQSGLSADEKNDIPIAHSKAGSSRHYPKGSFVIDMLSVAAGGHAQFQKVITNYLKRYGFKHVDTHLFQMEFMETFGLNLDWFFDQWIYKGTFPVFEISYNHKEDSILVYVNQTQEMTSISGVFKVQTNIEIATQDGQKLLYPIEINEKNEQYSFYLPKEAKITYLLFDKGNHLYKKIDFERSYDELIAQAKNAEDMIDRFLALKELTNTDIDTKRNDLIEIYNKETFFATKSLIIKQLANDENKQSKKLLTIALQDDDLQVRRAVLDYVEKVDKKMEPTMSVLLKDASFVNIGKALDKLTKNFPENKQTYLDVCASDALKNTYLHITWLKTGADLHKENIKTLVDYTSNSFEFRTRLKAMEAIEEMDYFDKTLLNNLLNASVSFNRHLAGTARNILVAYAENSEYKIMIQSAIKELQLDKNEEKRLSSLLSKLE